MLASRHVLPLLLAAMQGSPPTAASPLQMTAANWALLALHAMLWGSAYFFIAVANRELPPYTIASLRLVPGIALLLVVIWLSGERLPATRQAWGRYLILAAGNNYIPFALTVTAQREVTGGVAALIVASTPVFTLFLAHVATHDERLTANRLAGVLIGLAGVAVLALPDLVRGVSGSGFAKLALLGAALLYALAGIYARSFRNTPPLVIATSQMMASFLLSLPLMLILDRPWTLPAPSLQAAGAVVAMGLLASALASICYFTLIKRAGATNALLGTLLLPLTPIVLGAAILGDRLSGRDMMGGAVIALALLVIDGRVLRWLPGARPPR